MSRQHGRALADLLVDGRRVVVLHDPFLTEEEVSGLDLPASLTVCDLSRAQPDPGEVDGVLLAVADLTGLRRCVTAVSADLTAATIGTIVVRGGPTPPVLLPHPSWPPLSSLDVQVGEPTISIACFAAPAPARRVLAALARSVAPGATTTAGWPSTGAPLSEPHRWPVVDLGTRVGEAAHVQDVTVDFPPALVVSKDPWTLDRVEHPVTGRAPVTVAVGEEPVWDEPPADLADALRLAGPTSLGPLDERLLNPIGFKRQHRRPVARLVPHEHADLLGLRTADGVTGLDARHGPSPGDIEGLRRLAGIHLGWEGARGPHAYARYVAGLAMAGVPLTSHQTPEWAASLLHPALITALDSAPPHLDDIVEREAYSIRLRRAALDHHGQVGWRRDAGTVHGLQTTPAPRVSVLLPTRRPEQVTFALRQVSRQRGVDLELVLVTHGFAADPAVLEEFRRSTDVPLSAIEAPADLMFGAVLNLAARAASGDLLLKMDDDDWYGRDFLADLLLARRYSGADVVGTPPEFTFVEPLWLTVRRQDATEAFRPVVAGGTMLIDRSAFVALGGFRETRKFVDAGLLAAVIDAGGTVYRSHGHGYVLRRGTQGHTWDPGLGYFVGRKLSWQQWRGFRPSPLLEADELRRAATGRERRRGRESGMTSVSTGRQEQPRVRGNDWPGLSPATLGEWAPTLSVSIVIPAYGAARTLPYTLAALALQSYPDDLLEVVVVDDGTEPPLELPERRPTNTRIVRTTESWGRAHACHTGALASSGRIIHWLDADMLPHRDEVEAQLRWHHLVDHAVVMGHKLFVDVSDEAGGLPDLEDTLDAVAAGRATGLFADRWTSGHEWVEEHIGKTQGLTHNPTRSYLVHTGASASVPRDLYDESGGMAADLKLGEDVELGYRLAQQGALFVPDDHARSWHLGRTTLMQQQDEVNRYNRPFVTDRVPDLRHWRTKGRSYTVPWIRAVVDVRGARLEAVKHSVDALLTGSAHDVEVVLLGAWGGLGDERRSPLGDPDRELRLVQAEYAGEGRVSFAESTAATAFPAPYRLLLPAGWAPERDAVARLAREMSKLDRGLVSVLLGDGQVARLERTSAFARARRLLVPGEVVDDAVDDVSGTWWFDGREEGFTWVEDAGDDSRAGEGPSSPSGPRPSRRGSASREDIAGADEEGTEEPAADSLSDKARRALRRRTR